MAYPTSLNDYGNGVDFGGRVDGALTLDAAATTTISVTGTAVKVAGNTSPWSINQRFTHSNNRLTYTGSIPKIVDVDSSYAVATTNNQTLSFYIAKNGSLITESRAVVRIGTGNDERFGAISGIVSIESGDYLELWVANDSSTDNIEIAAMSFKASD